MASTKKERIRLVIHGRVQGVFFRASAQEEASRCNLAGWVRNLVNGSVEVVAEGDERALDEFAKWCSHGPPYAKVSHVDVSKESYTGEFYTFQILH
ncbi:MAG: acylphosphatase [bacterium]